MQLPGVNLENCIREIPAMTETKTVYIGVRPEPDDEDDEDDEELWKLL